QFHQWKRVNRLRQLCPLGDPRYSAHVHNCRRHRQARVLRGLNIFWFAPDEKSQVAASELFSLACGLWPPIRAYARPSARATDLQGKRRTAQMAAHLPKLE